jgi:hypothetical protein
MHIRPAQPQPDATAEYVALPSTLGGPKWVITGRDQSDVMVI